MKKKAKVKSQKGDISSKVTAVGKKKKDQSFKNYQITLKLKAMQQFNKTIITFLLHFTLSCTLFWGDTMKLCITLFLKTGTLVF